jgi:putative DNA primase/helicase
MTGDIERARRADIKRTAERLGVVFQPAIEAAIERFGPCPLGCAKKDGFSVNTRDQVFYCRPARVGGNVIAMVMHVLCCPFIEAVAFINVERPSRIDREARAGRSRTAKEYDAAAAVRRIVGALRPILGTPGEMYLSRSRRIDTSQIVDLIAEPRAIGWNPSILFRDDGHPLDGERLGAIIAVMTDPITAKPTGGISRTYIDRDLNKVGKAKGLGPTGVVRLTHDDELMGALFVGEGMETCLAAAARWGLRPIWSLGSTASMARLPVIPAINRVVVLCDHDENGAGERAARELEERWLDADRAVTIYRPKNVGDLNDLLMGG